MKKCSRYLSAAALVLASLAMPGMAQTVGTDITYQGRLKLSGNLVNSSADLQFRLFTSSSGGSQVGSTQSFTNVSVVDGLFTSRIDFGANAFTGEARFLEVAVRAPSGVGNFVILTPRQAITAAPYALKVPGIDGNSLNSPDGSIIDAVQVTNSGNVSLVGNLGIGTTSPQGKFDLRSGGGSFVRIDSTNGDFHANGGTDGVFGFYNDTTGSSARTEIVMNNQAMLVVNGDGQVGIGTTTPTQFRRFNVVEPGIFTGRFEGLSPIGAVVELRNGNINNTWEWGVTGTTPPAGLPAGGMYFAIQGGSDIPLSIAPNSWVGLGLATPGFRLDLPNISSNDGRGRANSWTTYSSIRWKDNVQTIENPLEKVMNLRGVRFDWKPEHGGAHDIGFVAEEVGKVVPELVSWEKDGQWAQGVAYDHITAITVEAIKEQQGQIVALQQANAQLRDQVAKLMETVAAMSPGAK